MSTEKELMTEIEKVKQQVDYYSKEAEVNSKLYEKERLDHEETKKATLAMMIQFKNAMDTDVATKMAIQSVITEKAGDIIKSANAMARASATIEIWINKLEQDLKKNQKNQQQQQQQPQQNQ